MTPRRSVSPFIAFVILHQLQVFFSTWKVLQLAFQAPGQIDATIEDILTNQPLALTISKSQRKNWLEFKPWKFRSMIQKDGLALWPSWPSDSSCKATLWISFRLSLTNLCTSPSHTPYESPSASAHRRAVEVEPRICGRVTPTNEWLSRVRSQFFQVSKSSHRHSSTTFPCLLCRGNLHTEQLDLAFRVKTSPCPSLSLWSIPCCIVTCAPSKTRRWHHFLKYFT